MTAPLIEAEGITKRFEASGGLLRRSGPTVYAVNGVSFSVAPGETLALIGESGCGKTTLARTVARLYPADGGRVRFKGEDVTQARGKALKPFRRAVQMVFQDPYGALDPRLTAGAIVAEPLVIHRVGNRRSRRDRVAEMMATVGLSAAQMTRYPHEFSGGQRQRLGIARAIALDPELIVADEPVSALDVSVQSQILNLMRDLARDRGLAYLFITHDLAVVNFIADRVAVMYLGEIVELSDRDALFADPRHPYTRTLMRAVPVPGHGKRARGAGPAGEVPSPTDIPSGCPFHPRCPMAQDNCRVECPELREISFGRQAACFYV